MRTCRARSVAEKTKSSTSRPSRRERLRAHAGEGGLDVGDGQLGHVARGGAHERRAQRRVAQLGHARAPPAREHPPRAGPGERVEQVAAAHGGQAVGVARPGDQGGGPDQHLAVDVLGQVHAEERQRRVGHRVDQRAHERAALGHQAQVGAAEGHDARIGVGAGRDGQAIGPRAGAEDRVGGLGAAARVPEAQRSRGGGDSGDLARGRHRAAGLAHVLGVGARDGCEVDDAGVRRVQPGDPAGVRLELLDAVRVDAPQTRARRWRGRGARARPAARARCESVATITLPQRSLRDSPLGAVLVQLARALHAQPRLQRAGLVVDAGVDHARVVAGLMAAHSSARARARRPTRRGLRASSSRATASPTIPPPTTARSQRSGAVCAVGLRVRHAAAG